MLTTVPITNGGDQRVDRLALVVEDDDGARLLLVKSLEREGFSPLQAANVHEATEMLERHPVSIVLLDLGLPDGSGLEFLRARRDAGDQTPVIIVSGWGDSADKVAGLRLGADDYLAKPFSFAELAARLRALVRRGPVERPAVLQVGDLVLDPAAQQVSRDGTAIDLSAKEFALLSAFMRRPGRVLSRLQLLEHAWDMEYENRSNIVDVYVRYLRDKVDRPFGVESIETVRGVGYRMREPSPS